MTVKNYSQFPAAGPLTGTELIPLWQGGVTKQTPLNTIVNSAILVAPSGDVTGVLDTANFIAAYLAAIANPTLAAQGGAYAIYHTIKIAAGEYYINAPYAMMNATHGTPPAVKLTGLVFEGQGSEITVINYNPSVSGPLCQNQRILNLQFKGFTFYGNDA